MPQRPNRRLSVRFICAHDARVEADARPEEEGPLTGVSQAQVRRARLRAAAPRREAGRRGIPSSRARTFEVPPGSRPSGTGRAIEPGRRLGDCAVASADGDEVDSPATNARMISVASPGPRGRRVDELESPAAHPVDQSTHVAAQVALAGRGVVDEDAAFHGDALKRAPHPAWARRFRDGGRPPARPRGRGACAAGTPPAADTARRDPRACRGLRRGTRRSRRRRPGRHRTSR